MNKTFKLTLFISGILIGIFLLNVEVTAVNMALVDISRSLHFNIKNSDLVITAMMVSFAAVIITAGRMGDTFGYYRIILTGLIAFIIGAGLCAVSTNMPILLAGRLFQGIGAGLCSSNLVTFAYVTFPDRKRGFVSGLTMGTVGLAISFGPLFGGFFTQVMTWRWIFWIDLPIGLISILLITKYRPHFGKIKTKGKIDSIGLIIAAVFMTTLTMAFQTINETGFMKYLYSAAALTSLISFFYFERKIANPLIDIKLFKDNPSMLVGFAGRFISVLVFWIVLFVAGIFLEKDLQFSPISSGIILMPMTLCVGLLSPLSGILIDKFGTKMPNILGTAGFLISSLLLLSYSFFYSWTLFFLMLVIFGISFSISSTSFLHFTLEASPDKNKGLTSAIYYMLSLLGGLVGLPLVSPLVTGAAIDLKAVAIICIVASLVGVMIFTVYYKQINLFF